jgi:hypothetical protein
MVGSHAGVRDRFVDLSGNGRCRIGRSFARRSREKRIVANSDGKDGGPDGYIVSAVLGLLALLLGFTFALAVDRFETRRVLVLEEANAIGTTYLYAQLLDEPHRSRMSALLRDYTGNRIALAAAAPRKKARLFAQNDRLLVDLWSATAAVFDDVKATAFSASLLQSVSHVIDLDTARKSAREARVPTVALMVLMIYVVVTAGMLGYVRVASQGLAAVALLFGLMAMSLMLILDIDRPVGGGITESQEPMVTLRDTLLTRTPRQFDRWRKPST